MLIEEVREAAEGWVTQGSSFSGSQRVSRSYTLGSNQSVWNHYSDVWCHHQNNNLSLCKYSVSYSCGHRIIEMPHILYSLSSFSIL